MRTSIDLRGADLCVYPPRVDTEGGIHLELNDCEGGDLGLHMDKQAAVDIIEKLQEAVAPDLINDPTVKCANCVSHRYARRVKTTNWFCDNKKSWIFCSRESLDEAAAEVMSCIHFEQREVKE